ncbi:MAG TPA: hypothetical protein VEJ87_10540, partial [Acidimicrobiales bacterium]|nr:hypothetical protein [Acidimicrobiales bacterium]
ITGDQSWRQVVEETVAYVLRDLSSPGGGICSAEDADSDGEEGLFYLWTLEQIREVLGDEPSQVAVDWYGVDAGGNFEGRSILRRPPGAVIVRPPEVELARRELFDARETRVRPGLDDKVLTEWNAMFCSALAEAAGAMGRSDWASAAGEIAEFLWTEMRRTEDGRLMRSWQGGRARHLAFAADYAWLVDCFTRMAELSGRAHWVDRASWAAEELTRLFSDKEGGPLFTSGSDAETLVVRPRDVLDGATPSANSVAATALLRLAALTGDETFENRGASLVDVLAPLAREHPLALANSIAAAAMNGGGATEVVIAGDRRDLVDVVQRRFEPTVVMSWGEPRQSLLWEGRKEGLAYVCRRFVCHEPEDSATALEASLEAARRADGRDFELGSVESDAD